MPHLNQPDSASRRHAMLLRMLGPILEGEGCTSQAAQPRIFQPLRKWWADLAATRYLLVLQFPPSPKQHDDWLEKVTTVQDDIVWVIVDRSDTTLMVSAASSFCGARCEPRVPSRPPQRSRLRRTNGHTKQRRRGHA
jgi:hypothetical protein